MPRKEGQKLKLMTLLEIFLRETDEKHPLGVPRLVELLEERGVSAERKSIYDDIDTLNNLPGKPFEIQLRRGRGGGYYMAESIFQLAELKLLVDAVYASRFITRKKSEELIKKLYLFASRYQAAELSREVLVAGRGNKNQVESILTTVDTLHNAITAKCQVSFQYYKRDLKKNMVARHEGRIYRVSPWKLLWDGGNYYLIAYADGKLRHYRVDRMKRIELLENCPREGAQEYRDFDVNTYMQQLFGMFSGNVEKVTLRCENGLADAMVDRFGADPVFVPSENNTFTMDVTVQVSPQFYGWVAGFGGGVEILAPAQVRARMAEQLERLQRQYR